MSPPPAPGMVPPSASLTPESAIPWKALPNEERGLALREPTACGCTQPSAPALMVSDDVVEEAQTKGQEV